ncbi:cytochrome c4 [Pseudomonas entomophila]|uniref:c-type cytochrome n=1 Tax=Pseudomonas entomophila TaxID=312306 RepID=UPI0015E39CFD|nr:c-type cytochrome [Pseudomonas entomophila]MBA1191528.1 cytochrome c4 [Pseudomonas entomophila]
MALLRQGTLRQRLRLYAGGVLLTLCGAGAAQAEPLQGEAAAGQAKSAVCGACHNPDGNSLVPIFPKLAGQGERYLLEQLRAIRSGARVVPEMTGLLTPSSDQDLADLAAWYASQSPTTGFADPALVQQGRALFNGGDLQSGLPACLGCHAPDGAGVASAGFPRLGGQHAAYVSKQLKAFREGQRTEASDAVVMHSIAARLSDAQIDALSSYIQGLH